MRVYRTHKAYKWKTAARAKSLHEAKQDWIRLDKDDPRTRALSSA
jgi:hypothetical protein